MKCGQMVDLPSSYIVASVANIAASGAGLVHLCYTALDFNFSLMEKAQVLITPKVPSL